MNINQHNNYVSDAIIHSVANMLKQAMMGITNTAFFVCDRKLT